MILRNATVFWRFKNIKKNFNDEITDPLGTKLDIISEGCCSFQHLQEVNYITLAPNFHNNTCSITPLKTIKLGNLGVMLGFAKDATLTRGVKADGIKPVDVHHNLRFVKLSADIVDKSNVFSKEREVKYLPHFQWKANRDYSAPEQSILIWTLEFPL